MFMRIFPAARAAESTYLSLFTILMCALIHPIKPIHVNKEIKDHIKVVNKEGKTPSFTSMSAINLQACTDHFLTYS